MLDICKSCDYYNEISVYIKAKDKRIKDLEEECLMHMDVLGEQINYQIEGRKYERGRAERAEKLNKQYVQSIGSLKGRVKAIV